MLDNENKKPLADRMRPEKLSDFVGQEGIIGEGKILRKIIESDQIPSMIFWGPPGSGKTTLARIIAKMTNAKFFHLSAVSSGVKEIRKIIEEAKNNPAKKTILFLDEIHRFNKAQQDRLLPYVEDGTLILIGATTENPSFEVNYALLSRSRVFVLESLDEKDIKVLIERALKDSEKGLGKFEIKIAKKDIKLLAGLSNGDARVALGVLEFAVSAVKNNKKEIVIGEKDIKEALQKSNLLYDRAGEQHYNIISALHKSMRGGDANAALYWLARMLSGGEDPLYIARRLIRFASEDIGIANSFALEQAVSAYQACHYIGMPECGVNLAQAVVYMAKSKKSNQLYIAYENAKKDAENFPAEPVPIHLRNAPTKFMKNLGYGKDYKYTPDFENPEDAEQQYFPDKLKKRKYL
ncbi:MAG: AAA ATPase central domain protein [Candidatus Moranbacteria bacterium GW2011_GWE2_35_2-]|nr:MAG: AAA ATPase central domain protein [Candidatus Moranbacteria bacterium GW2011_GWE2_35_2-]KKQ22734.1 MAG: AAA ATPase central domain protein [Candidatus Moranbacteria bacterium GW2011_GWF2_37_11]KKQ28888.1 MAG: AAA ATPase central domain protein [Candidatus Moranbacteria bacterium GW2011_GWD1_37_17]KKQ31035.1 MAG: AAA ATPase central domain protein [Candidatus Moranbacteria bacterium GW2011_GWE1_37_24]KKQ48098.1 MAG: AAA ATPase central domain protein [Candidatus Moranbacteria bacterium GW201